MRVRSLALTTELALARTRGNVIDRGDYLVVTTPDDPGYYHGNVLVLPAAPQVGEVTYWTRKFASELGGNPAIKHVTLWWDTLNGDTGAAEELRAAGFEISTTLVMVADALSAPPLSPPLSIRPLIPVEVLATADLAWAIGDRHDDAYRQFLTRRASWHRQLVERGEATFWGAFDGEQLVGTLGIVRLGELARYQDVQVLPSHRNRGVASALLAVSAANEAPRRLVIVTHPDTAASRLYEHIGFRTVERSADALRRPR